MNIYFFWDDKVYKKYCLWLGRIWLGGLALYNVGYENIKLKKVIEKVIDTISSENPISQRSSMNIFRSRACQTFASLLCQLEYIVVFSWNLLPILHHRRLFRRVHSIHPTAARARTRTRDTRIPPELESLPMWFALGGEVAYVPR
jgi:predicted acyltransferase